MNTSLDGIKKSLQQGLELELFTIPPYLSALYSIHEGTNLPSRDVIQSVVMEEMLHMMLVANVLNAIGGRPRLHAGDEPGGPRRRYYPALIPHIITETKVDLRKFSPEAIQTFMEIEAPEEATGCVSPDWKFETIGEFYQDIKHRLVAICEEQGERKVFTGNPALQVDRKTEYYGGGGEVIAVRCLADALQAIDQIMEQGEGRLHANVLSGNAARFGQPKEAAHYFRFNQIQEARYYTDQNNVSNEPQGERLEVNWDAVYPMKTNPKYPKEPNAAQEAFIDTYQSLLQNLDLGLQGRRRALARSVEYMHALEHDVRRLMRVNSERGKTTLGAPFWFIQSKENK